MTRVQSLKARIGAKDLVIGSWIQIPNPHLAEIMTRAGFDFLVIDTEHSAFSPHQVFQAIQIVSLAGVPVLVRVGANDQLLIKHALDAGADGIIVPMVETRTEAEAARDWVYYPPKGRRGVGLARAQGFGRDFPGYRDRAADETILIVQIEHRRAVEQLDSILSVDGVDGFLVGPYDLSGSFGKPGKFDDPEVAAALSAVAHVARTHAKPSGMHVVQVDAALLRQRIAEGYRIIAFGIDMLFFADAVHAVTKTLEDVRSNH